MGSVYVRWTGRCIDVEARTKLLEKVADFALLSLNYFEEFGAFQRYNGTLEGRILLSPTYSREPAWSCRPKPGLQVGSNCAQPGRSALLSRHLPTNS
jgi:hypothetical protein